METVRQTCFFEAVASVLCAVSPLAAGQVHQGQLTHTDLVRVLAKQHSISISLSNKVLSNNSSSSPKIIQHIQQ